MDEKNAAMTPQMAAFRDFLAQYQGRLEEALEEQKEKLAVILTHDVEAIENNMAKQQALTLRMKNWEETRMRLQEEAGFGGKTMEEIADSLEGEERRWFQDCLAGLRRTIQEIKYINGKAMQAVETDLTILRLARPGEDGEELEGYTETGSHTVHRDRESLLDSKI